MLDSGDLLVFNDTRVLKARFFGVKETGGKVQVLIERVIDSHTACAQICSSRPPPVGSSIRLAGVFDVIINEKKVYL